MHAPRVVAVLCVKKQSHQRAAAARITGAVRGGVQKIARAICKNARASQDTRGAPTPCALKRSSFLLLTHAECDCALNQQQRSSDGSEGSSSAMCRFFNHDFMLHHHRVAVVVRSSRDVLVCVRTRWNKSCCASIAVSVVA